MNKNLPKKKQEKLPKKDLVKRRPGQYLAWVLQAWVWGHYFAVSRSGRRDCTVELADSETHTNIYQEQ